MPTFGAEEMKNMNELQVEAGEDGQKLSNPSSVTRHHLEYVFSFGSSQLFQDQKNSSRVVPSGR